uniref:hypothetical protein n=1 Tax=Metapseudomonas otitidis TaxID=319939 RepID=UPI001980F1AE
LEFNQQGVMGGLATGDDLVAWPESSKINRMHGGSRGWGLVRLATANLPPSLTVNSLFPLIPRRTKEKGADLFDCSPNTGLALVLFYLRSAPSNSYRGDSN